MVVQEIQEINGGNIQVDMFEAQKHTEHSCTQQGLVYQQVVHAQQLYTLQQAIVLEMNVISQYVPKTTIYKEKQL